jgi:pimeloyl-ACP methyl ester carboxylesterase
MNEERVTAATTIRRSFVDCKFGQMHLHLGSPVAPAVPERPALLCIHQTPKSSRQMLRLARNLATDRLVYAPDLPGFGDSDPPTEPPRLQDYAQCLWQMLDWLNVGQVDVLGNHTGAMNAVELALQHPDQVRRLVLIGIPVLSDEEQAAIRQEPFPLPSRSDGSHLTAEWVRTSRWAGPGQTRQMLREGFLDKLKAGDTGYWGALAASHYPMAERLPRVRQPILAIGPQDDLWEISPRAEPLIRNGTFERWPDFGFGVLEVAPERLNAAIRRHLDS